MGLVVEGEVVMVEGEGEAIEAFIQLPGICQFAGNQHSRQLHTAKLA